VRRERIKRRGREKQPEDCGDCGRESVAVRIARRPFLPFKINPPICTNCSWQMATESGAEIDQSTASGRLRVRVRYY